MQSEPTAARPITLKTLVTCSLEQQTRVREIRNQPGIRAAMYTDHEIGLNEHLGWISKLKSDPAQIVFAVLDEAQRPIGVVSVNDIDTRHRKADWAFYLGENERGGLGAALEATLLDFVFGELGLEKLNCEVIETNEAVVKMHKKFGFVEEGFRRENIEKDGRRIGVYFLGLTRAEWQSARTEVLEKYRSVTGRFTVRIEQEAQPEDGPLTQIERARARNNVNWMALLRLSVEQHPDIAKPIVSEILRLDTEISALTRQLVR